MATDKPTDELAILRGEADAMLAAMFGECSMCGEGPGFHVVAVVDNDVDKHGTLFHGYVISSPLVLEHVDCHAVVITSFGRQDEIHQQLQPISVKRGLETVRL